MTQPTWEQAIEHGPAGRLPEPYQTRWDSIAAGISHVYFASDEDYDEAIGRELSEEEFDRFCEWDWQRQKRVIAIAFFELLRLVAAEREACARVCEEPTDQTYDVRTSIDGFEHLKQMRMPKTAQDCANSIRARKDNHD